MIGELRVLRMESWRRFWARSHAHCKGLFYAGAAAVVAPLCGRGCLLTLVTESLPQTVHSPAGISPESGPVFGETEVTISGLRFRPGSIKVRFAGDHSKSDVTVDAEYVDATTIRCKTPNFEAFGACGADVRVSINGDGWTVNRLGYSYFANTAARNCLAFGPGLLPTAGAFGLSLPFVIQARDTLNERRNGGGDEFTVRVTGAAGTKSVEGAMVDVRSTDNGLYQAQYSVPLPGTYQVGQQGGWGVGLRSEGHCQESRALACCVGPGVHPACLHTLSRPPQPLRCMSCTRSWARRSPSPFAAALSQCR